MKHGWFLALLAIISSPAIGQQQLGKYWFKQIAELPRLDPYQILDPAGYLVFPTYDPVLTLSNGDLVVVWRPEFAGQTRRRVTRFNLFMEPVWDQELSFDIEEELFFFSNTNDTLLLLSAHLDSRNKRQLILARYLEPDSGLLQRQETLLDWPGTDDSPLFFSVSPNHKMMVFFQLQREQGERRVLYYTDYLNSRGELGFHAHRYDAVRYQLVSPGLDLLESGIWNLEPGKKDKLLDLSLDDEGSLYVSTYTRPDQLTISMLKPGGNEARSLTYRGFPAIDQLRYLYDTGFPPYVMGPGELLLPMVERIDKGRHMGIQAVELVRFDFSANTVGVSHRAESASGLLVALEKTREEINNRRLRRFDQFVIRNVTRLPDGRTWVTTQFFAHDQFRGMASSSPDIYRQQEQEVGELIIFSFDSSGKPVQAIIVPTSQHLRGIRDRTNLYADLHYDFSAGELRVLMREPSGDSYRGPERLYLRRVNLESGAVSNRQQIYEPDRRTLHAPFAFIEWINADILHLLAYEGDDERIYGVTINLAQPAADSSN